MICKKITFYSYKGGVGRSLALVNVATILANKGKNVACLDYDIEAPGLHNFFKMDNNSIQSGLLELLNSGNMSNFYEYVYDKNDLNLSLRGNLYLLPCEIDLQKLEKISFDMETNKGSQTFEDMVKLPDEICSYFSPDYILIDSRTGYTDPTTASFMAADIIVIVFKLNNQNLHGIKDLIVKFKTMMPDKQLFYCASSIPESKESNKKIQYFKEELGIDINFIIPYNVELDLDEKICILEMPESRSTKKYDELATLLERL